MKVKLEGGKDFDLGQDLASHGLEIVGSKGREWYNFFKNKEDQVLRVRDKDGKEHELDAYAYLANKGERVDAEATFKQQKGEALDAKSQADREHVAARKKELDDAGMGDYFRESLLPYSSTLNKSGKMGAGRAAISGTADVLSLLPRGAVGLYDQARYSLTGGKSGAPIAVSMSSAPDYGADTVKDPETGKDREENLGEHASNLNQALRMDTWGVVKDIAKESIRDPLTGLAILASLGTGGAASPIAGGRVGSIMANVANKYKPLLKAADVGKRAGDLVRKVDEKIAQAGIAAKMAHEVVGSTAVGGAQGVILNWAMGSDKDAWNTFVIEGIEEGAFDMAIATMGRGAGAAWQAMGRGDKKAYLDNLRDEVQAKPEIGQLPPGQGFPMLPPPGQAVEDGAFTEVPALPGGQKLLETPESVFGRPPRREPVTPGVIPMGPGAASGPTIYGENPVKTLPSPGAVPPIAVIPNAPGVTLIEGVPVDVNEALPPGVSRADVLQKRANPSFKTTAEKDADKARLKLQEQARADVKTLTAAVKKMGKEAEQEVQKAFKEALADVQAEDKALADKGARDLQDLRKAVNAIIDPTVPTSFDAWDKTLGSAFDTLPEKRKAFEDFHIKESKQAKAIKEKITPPKAPEGGGPAPRPTVAPDALLEPGKGAPAPRFDAGRGQDLARSIKAKLKAQGEKVSAAPAAEGGKVEVAPSAQGSPPAGGMPAAPAAAPRAKAPPRSKGEVKAPRERATERIQKKPLQVFDESKLDDLLARLDKKLGNRLSANPGFDPELMALATEIGGIYVQKGINSFIDWTDKMRASLGEKIGPFLGSIWESIQNYPQDIPFDPEIITQLFEFGGIVEERDEEWSRETLAWHFEHEFGANAVPYVDSIYEALEAFPKGISDEQQSFLPDGDGATGIREEGGPPASEGREPVAADAGGGGGRKPRRGSNWRNPPEPAPVPGGDDPVKGTIDEPQGARLGGSLAKNIDLAHKAPIELTPAKRRDANAAAVEVLERVWTDLASMTEADRDVLRRYTGLGGIEVSKTDTAEADDHGVRYQHYTSYQVVKNTWRLLEATGWNANKRGLTALEPTAGIGNFIGFSPRQIKWRANEVDDVGGRIMKLLYPGNDANIIGPFESYVGPKVDLVVTNVPFLKGRGRFAYMEKNKAYDSITGLHNYVIMKSIDHLKDNGVGVFLTSTGTLDAKTSAEFRKQLNQKAELVTAVRLPEGAFKKNAQYEGTVDLLVFRKRTTGEMTDQAPEQRIQPEFVNVIELKVSTDYGGEGKAYRSAWYDAHPELVMGQWVYGHNRGITQAGVALDVGTGTFEQALEGKFRELLNLPAIKGTFRGREGAADEASLAQHGDALGEAALETPHNGLEVKGGKVGRKATDGQLYPFRPEKPEKGDWAIPDSAYSLLTEIMELTDRLYKAISEGRDLSFLQGEIKVRLERWQGLGYKKQPRAEIAGTVKGLLPGVSKKQGTQELQFRDPALELWVDQDQRYWRLRSLYNSPMTGFSRLLSDQVRIQQAPAVAKGNMKKGPDLVRYVMQKFGVFREEVARREFDGTDDEFRAELEKTAEMNWDGERFLHDNEYLVGNLWPKIDVAREAKRSKELAKLEKVLPEQKTWKTVEAAPQATWWSPDALSEFARTAGLDLGRGQYLGRIQDPEGKIRFRIGTLGRAEVFEDGDSHIEDVFTVGNFVSIILNQEVGTTRVEDENADGGYRIVADPVRTSEVRKTWKERFDNWARSDGRRHAETAAVAFNRGFAGNAVQQYSEEKLFVEGLASTINGKAFTPYPHQYASNRMAKNLFGGLLAWGVGYGKTRGAILQFAQLRADGKVKKALFVVPEKTMFMWRDNFFEAIPGVNVKVIRGEQESTRIPDMQDAAVGDYDVVVIGHNSLPRVPLKAMETYITEDISLHRDRIDKLEREKTGKKGDRDEKARDALVKKINDKVDRLVNKLRKIQEDTLDPRIVTMEMWNIDAVWADEAHAYKNYFDILHEYADKQFLNTGKDSDIGNDFQYKTRFIHQKNGRGGVFLLTATPTPNKPVEIYKMMKLIAPWELADRGLETMDDFVRNFVEIGYANATGIDGIAGEPREMVLAYRNLNALRDMVKSYVDIRLLPSEEIKKLRPTEKREQVKVDMSDAQMFGMAKVVTLSSMGNKALREIGYDKLTLTGEARMLAVDPARVNPEILKEEPDFTKRAPKLGKVMEVVGKRFKEHGRLQLVFLDEFKIRDVMPVLDEAGNKIPWPAGFGPFPGRKGDLLPRFALALEDAVQRKQLIARMEKSKNLDTWPLKRQNGALFIPEKSADVADYRPIFAEDGEIYVGRREVVEDLHNRMAEHAEKVLRIPRDQIAVVNGEKNAKPQEKRAIEEKVERRELKLIIGNRKALGEGMNLQTEGDAIHQVDVPWNPRSLIQAEGRFIRARADETDKHPVTVFYYGAIGSLDAKMYEVNEQKKSWQDDLWLGNKDTVSNELDNLEDNGFDPQAMKESLQVNNAYVAGYQTYTAVQAAKRQNQGAVKERGHIEDDLRRAKDRLAHAQQMMDNAAERIEHREAGYQEDLKKFEEKAKTHPEAKAPEQPMHGRDQEIINRHQGEMKDIAELAGKLEEKLAAFSKVSWEADLVLRAERMVSDAKAHKFKSVGTDLSVQKGRLEKDAQFTTDEDKKQEAGFAVGAIQSKLDAWQTFVRSALPDIAAKFSHLADMVVTIATGGDMAMTQEKVQEKLKKYDSQAGKLDSKTLGILGVLASSAFTMPFLGPGPTIALYGAAGAAFFGYKRLARTEGAKRLTWSLQARLREIPGFDLLEDRFQQASLQQRMRTSTDHYALDQVLDGLPEADRLQVAAKVEDPTLQVSPAVAKAADVWRRIADRIARQAGTVGFNFGPNPVYYPRVFDWDQVEAMKKDPALLDRNVVHLMATQKLSKAEAEGLLLNFFDNTDEMKRDRAKKMKEDLIAAIRRRHPNMGDKGIINQYLRMKQAYGEMLNGNLRFQRRAPKLLDEMYVRDPAEVLPRYIENTWKTITYRRTFGQSNQLIEDWLDTNWPRWGEEKQAEREEVEEWIDTELYGHRFASQLTRNQEAATQVSRATQGFHVWTKLFTSPLAIPRNVAFGLNTSIPLAGTRSTFQGIAKVLSEAAKGQPFRHARVAGAISDRVIRDAYGMHKGDKRTVFSKFKDANWHPFVVSEKFVRAFAFHAGRYRAERLFRQALAGDKAALSELNTQLGPRLGPDLAAGTLSAPSADLFGLAMSEDIAGSTRPFRLTRWMNTPEGTVLFQFRRMAYAQTVMLKDRVILPATRGNFGPLLRWGAAVGMTSWMVGLVAAALKGDDQDKKKKEQGPAWVLLEYINQVNALGLYGDMAFGLDSGNDWAETPLVGTLAGPTVASILHLSKDLIVDVLRRGKPLEEELKQATRREVPLFNRLSKWEDGPLEWLAPEKKSGGLGGL